MCPVSVPRVHPAGTLPPGDVHGIVKQASKRHFIAGISTASSRQRRCSFRCNRPLDRTSTPKASDADQLGDRPFDGRTHGGSSLYPEAICSPVAAGKGHTNLEGTDDPPNNDDNLDVRFILLSKRTWRATIYLSLAHTHPHASIITSDESQEAHLCS